MNFLFIVFLFFFITKEECLADIIEQRKINQARRILRGNEVGDTRPYMEPEVKSIKKIYEMFIEAKVYLRPAQSIDPQDANWLCGGVIIHAQYILTSAACIEDIKQFYVVSGTHRWVSLKEENECIRNGAKKAVWKCVAKDYVFDGKTFDNIQWMKNDIAIVKVESDFNFKRRVRGCDFIPSVIAYNNKSEDLEAPATIASIAGWGSVDRFGDSIGRTSTNSPELLETDVVLISSRNCKRRWPERYHLIIDQHMICAKDVDSDPTLCKDQDINCKELIYSDEYKDTEDVKTRRFVLEPQALKIHLAHHLNIDARRSKAASGGFCENDHGGPLVYGHGKSSIAIGIISACMTAEITHKCYGPFLYTSIWKNRYLIDCVVNKEKEITCRRLFKSENKQIIGTNFDWPNDYIRKDKQETTKYSQVEKRSRNITDKRWKNARKHKRTNSTKIKII